MVYSAQGVGRMADSTRYHEGVGLEPEGDQVGDGAHLQAVLAGELDDGGQAHHGAVVVHQFRQGGGGLEACQAAQVDRGLGVAGAPQHAAVARPQREHVAGMGQVGRR